MASSSNNQKTEIIGYGSESVTVKPPIECLEKGKQLNNKIMTQKLEIEEKKRKIAILEKTLVRNKRINLFSFIKRKV